MPSTFPRSRKALAAMIAQRDNITEYDAAAQVEDCRQLIMEAIANDDYYEIDDILQDELGIEPDYIHLFI